MKKTNCLKDFVAIAGPLGVSNMLIFSKTERALYLRVCRLPRGPTLTFRVLSFTFARELLSALRRRSAHAASIGSQHHTVYSQPPLLVMNGFLSTSASSSADSEFSYSSDPQPSDGSAGRAAATGSDTGDADGEADSSSTSLVRSNPVTVPLRKLMVTLFQNMLPAINVTKLAVGSVSRVLMFNMDPVSQIVDLRH